MIEERTVTAAVCDACGKTQYSNPDGFFVGGYAITVLEYETDTHHDAFACRETHLGKAARAALERFRSEGNGGEGEYNEGGTLPSAMSRVAVSQGDFAKASPR